MSLYRLLLLRSPASSAYAFSGSSVYEEVEQKRTQRTTLNNAVRSNKFLPHVTHHDKPSSQLTVHAAQRSQHAGCRPCLSASMKAFFVALCQNIYSSQSTCPPGQNRQQVQIPQSSKYPSTRPQHVSQACNHATHCQPIFIANAKCRESAGSPQSAWACICTFRIDVLLTIICLCFLDIHNSLHYKLVSILSRRTRVIFQWSARCVVIEISTFSSVAVFQKRTPQKSCLWDRYPSFPRKS